MVVRQRKQKRIIYKRAEFIGGSFVLGELLEQAFLTKNKPALRRQSIGDEGTSDIRQVVGATKKEQNMLCGSLLMYEIGKDIAFVVADDEADEYQIESQNPAVGLEEGDQRTREVLQAALYFGVWDNHVVLVQSQALQSRQLENHLNWFLKECDGVMEQSVSLSLSDEPTQEARAALEGLQPKVVEIGTPFISQLSTTSNVQRVETHKITGKVKQLLSAFLSEDTLNRLQLEDALDDANLEATLQLRYKRKSTDSGYAMLDQIARAMRHAEPEDTKVITSSGSIITGDQLKLAGTISVDTYNGIVDNNDLFSQMHGWLASKFEEGSVG